MDFTREPIIETIITPREGHKLAIRNSKGGGQEEHFVDAVEIVSFGHALFFHSIEKPKAFLVPVSDYEVLEVREARVVLKNAGVDRSIKIGGGRESTLRVPKEPEKVELFEESEALEKEKEEAISLEGASDVKVDKKRDRRRHYRKRKGKDEGGKEEGEPALASLEIQKEGGSLEPEQEKTEPGTLPSAAILSSLLQPPPTLISETINRYRQNDLFKGAFYLTEEEEYKPHDKVQDLLSDDEEELVVHLKEPIFNEEEPVLSEESKEPELVSSEEEQQKERLEEGDEEGHQEEFSLEKEQEERSFLGEEEIETFSSLYEEEEQVKEPSQDLFHFDEPENHP